MCPEVNDERVEHEVGNLPVFFRSGDLSQIVNDISEWLTGIFYQEVTYTSTVFVSTVTGWKDNTKALKRFDVTLTYVGGTPPFVSQTVTHFYDESGVQCATITESYTYNANNTLTNMTTTVTRP